MRVLVVAWVLVLLSPQAGSRAAMIAEVVRTGSVIVAGVTFDRERTEPAASSGPALAELRAVLTEHDEWTFEVQVHTDETGAADTDLRLATSRAQAVVRWLLARGIEPNRLVAKGYGRTRPLLTAPAGDPALQHRRLELRKLNEE